MKQVSGRILGFYMDAAAYTGIPVEDIVGDSGLDLAHPPRWFGWSTFCRLNDRLEHLVGGPRAFEELGPRIHGTAGLGAYGRVIGLAVDARRLFWISHMWSGPAVFPELRPGYEEVAPGRLRLSITLPSHYRDSPQFFRLVSGLFATMPSLAGMGSASVELSLRPRQGVYDVLLPPSATLWQRLRRAWRVLVGSGERGLEYPAFEALISQQRALEDEIRAAHEALDHAVAQQQIAEAALRVRADFLSRMSHELRTPLSHIVGAADILGCMELDANQRYWVEQSQRGAGRLEELVADLLDFGQLEEGALAVAARAFDASDPLRRSVHRVEARAKADGVSVHLDLPDGPSARGVGDEVRVAQILEHLLNNAVSFSGGGAVHARLCVDDGGGELWVRYEIADSGPGVQPEDIERLFEPLTQADESLTRSHPGAGMGLALCRSLARAMGGDVSLEGRVEGGTRAIVRLPGISVGPS